MFFFFGADDSTCVENLIRTIQISTSAKALLKGHTSDISDVRFASDTANRFVSADVGGTFFVWDLKAKTEAGNDEPSLEFQRTFVVQTKLEEVRGIFFFFFFFLRREKTHFSVSRDKNLLVF